MERVKGIEPSSRFTFFKAFKANGIRLFKTLFLELFILTFILTSYVEHRQAQEISVLYCVLQGPSWPTVKEVNDDHRAESGNGDRLGIGARRAAGTGRCPDHDAIAEGFKRRFRKDHRRQPIGAYRRGLSRRLAQRH